MKQMTEARLTELLNAAYALGWKNRGMLHAELQRSKDMQEHKELVEDYEGMKVATIMTLVSQA